MRRALLRIISVGLIFTLAVPDLHASGRELADRPVAPHPGTLSQAIPPEPIVSYDSRHPASLQFRQSMSLPVESPEAPAATVLVAALKQDRFTMPPYRALLENIETTQWSPRQLKDILQILNSASLQTKDKLFLKLLLFTRVSVIYTLGKRELALGNELEGHDALIKALGESNGLLLDDRKNLRPGIVASLCSRAEELTEAGRINLAIELVKRGYEAMPRDEHTVEKGRLLIDVAKRLYQAKRFEQAEAVLSQADDLGKQIDLPNDDLSTLHFLMALRSYEVLLEAKSLLTYPEGESPESLVRHLTHGLEHATRASELKGISVENAQDARHLLSWFLYMAGKLKGMKETNLKNEGEPFYFLSRSIRAISEGRNNQRKGLPIGIALARSLAGIQSFMDRARLGFPDNPLLAHEPRLTALLNLAIRRQDDLLAYAESKGALDELREMFLLAGEFIEHYSPSDRLLGQKVFAWVLSTYPVEVRQGWENLIRADPDTYYKRMAQAREVQNALLQWDPVETSGGQRRQWGWWWSVKLIEKIEKSREAIFAKTESELRLPSQVLGRDLLGWELLQILRQNNQALRDCVRGSQTRPALLERLWRFHYQRLRDEYCKLNLEPLAEATSRHPRPYAVLERLVTWLSNTKATDDELSRLVRLVEREDITDEALLNMTKEVDVLSGIRKVMTGIFNIFILVGVSVFAVHHWKEALLLVFAITRTSPLEVQRIYDEILECLRVLSGIDPQRFWTLKEIGNRVKMRLAPSAISNLMAKMTDSQAGVEKQRLGTFWGYRWVKNGRNLQKVKGMFFFAKKMDGHFVHSKTILPNSRTHLFDFLWDSSGAEQRVLRYGQKHSIRDLRLAKQEFETLVMDELFYTYEVLRQAAFIQEAIDEVRSTTDVDDDLTLEEFLIAVCDRLGEDMTLKNVVLNAAFKTKQAFVQGWQFKTIEDLLSHLRSKRSSLVLAGAKDMKRGLQWLELNGFPLRRIGSHWFASPFLNGKFFNMHPAMWPTWAQSRWKELQGDESPQAIAERFEVIFRVHGLQYSVLGSEADKFHRQLQTWRKGNGNGHPDSLDKALEYWGAHLGLEPVTLRTGFTRTELEPKVFNAVKLLSVNKRSYEFRRLAGISRRTAAVHVGITTNNLRLFEEGIFDEFDDPAIWPKLAALYDVDAIVLYAGDQRPAIFPHLFSFQRIKIARLAKGWTRAFFARRAGVSDSGYWESENVLPSPYFQTVFAQTLGLEVSDLFGPTVEPRKIPIPSQARKLRRHA